MEKGSRMTETAHPDGRDVLSWLHIGELLPKAVVLGHYRCLFLAVVSEGTGGPDFRLGEAQLAWAEDRLEQAEAMGQAAAVFMHSYPADLREGAERLGALLAMPPVTCVDMGHTHYNELANDGATIFMATRSTGQIEEGPPGFAVAAVDGRGVSWRFQPLQAAWITCPVDRRLTTAASRSGAHRAVVRAKVIGDAHRIGACPERGIFGTQLGPNRNGRHW